MCMCVCVCGGGGGRGQDPSPEKLQKYRVSNTVSDPLKNYKTTKPAFNVGPSSAFKETKSANMNIFRFFYFLFKSFVNVELSIVFTINMFTIVENCTEK